MKGCPTVASSEFWSSRATRLTEVARGAQFSEPNRARSIQSRTRCTASGGPRATPWLTSPDVTRQGRGRSARPARSAGTSAVTICREARSAPCFSEATEDTRAPRLLEQAWYRTLQSVSPAQVRHARRKCAHAESLPAVEELPGLAGLRGHEPTRFGRRIITTCGAGCAKPTGSSPKPVWAYFDTSPG